MAKRSGKPDSIGGYFRTLFRSKPELLQQKKNDEILAHYRRDKGMSENEVIEKRIINNLANVKSVERKNYRKKGRKAAVSAGAPNVVERPRVPRNLEALEIMIDEAMMLSRSIDRELLEPIWRQLRAARNQVVMMMG